MEFTCDGMVRMGYGFYNPNHAAALICALLPFLWEWFLQTRRKIWKITAILLNLLLLTVLVFTFSRTGIIVVLLEAFLFAALKHKIHWKWIAIFAIVMLTLLCISGLWMRFRLDGGTSIICCESAGCRQWKFRKTGNGISAAGGSAMQNTGQQSFDSACRIWNDCRSFLVCRIILRIVAWNPENCLFLRIGRTCRLSSECLNF